MHPRKFPIPWFLQGRVSLGFPPHFLVVTCPLCRAGRSRQLKLWVLSPPGRPTGSCRSFLRRVSLGSVHVHLDGCSVPLCGGGTGIGPASISVWYGYSTHTTPWVLGQAKILCSWVSWERKQLCPGSWGGWGSVRTRTQVSWHFSVSVPGWEQLSGVQERFQEEGRRRGWRFFPVVWM